ncbi:TauD/TfdA dioxygenase family protein [Noviherbaspirillum sedimenti]|uniref:TauD/TfdA family dioxygenase n=1 Tax=Noviherbaspirillum sedimenti TaxID=2320865 RepID=A0A3A3FY19_9BURK|nr:TauD/TfdA family dioxygenase [Noviherbaspirillum sedimenti]RJG00614.1 TauD/TfdA family dioxygenase [Noviherbaspirillum sedimenti]
MKFETIPITENLGLEIRGLDLNLPQGDSTWQDLFDAWIKAGVLLFRGMDRTPQAAVNLSRHFGELELHPSVGSRLKDLPELIRIAYDPATDASSQNVYRYDGQERGAFQPWHSDLRYMTKNNRGALLCAVEVPAEGGYTGFIDQIQAYESLPDDLKTKIEDLWVIYRMNPDSSQIKFKNGHTIERVHLSKEAKALIARIEKDFPPVIHPMIYRQQETGRKVLNVSQWFALHIMGMEHEEGDRLLERVMSHAIDERLAYYHEWRPNDMVLFDNWRTLHCACGVPTRCKREMHRTTIMGDYGHGRYLDSSPNKASTAAAAVY